MGIQRRKFLKQVGAAGIGVWGLASGMGKALASEASETGAMEGVKDQPVVISTWEHGLAANETAYRLLSEGARALDAAEKGVNVSEDDPKVMSVGLGGLPDREGNVTLDACIMDEYGNAGSVGFLQGYRNAVSVARKVMEETPHVMLVGSGAEKFAKAMGFKKQKLLTRAAEREWRDWLQNPVYPSTKPPQTATPPPKDAPHDTIGMVTLDRAGNLSGACTTSGLANKMHGRVGDSPIIGAGLYVDNSVGGAAATGVGEECIKVCGSFVVVEMMRRGANPTEACMEAVKRIAQRHREKPTFQVAFIALNRRGEYGYFALSKGFQAAVKKEGKYLLLESDYLIK